MIIGASTAGLLELARTYGDLGEECAAAVKAELVQVGGEIRDEAASLFTSDSTIMPQGGTSAAGFKVRVRAGGVVRVEQSKRKTTGKRPDFGELQMRHAFLPARSAKLESAVAGIEGRIAAIFEAHSA